MRIDVISDVICPWCFIGKRRLERALKAPAEVVWHPFQLNPEMPAEGMARDAYLAAKFGGRAQRVYDEIARVGAEEGIDFAFDAIARTPNTVDAHRLIAYAHGHGRQDAVVEGLFRRYFLEGGDIGRADELVAVAAAAGLDAAAVADFLASGGGADDVRRADAEARALGINGVPCFIVAGRYAVSGAQAPEVFERVFEAAAVEAAAS